MSPLRPTAAHLDDLAVHLGGWSSADPGPRVFGADLPGRLGELGRELHGRWSGELSARTDTATTLAGRLTETAATLRTAGSGYAGAEDDATRRATQAGEP
ncbi:hypothetical protein Ais01nite_34980 [Asanoa ishikariensis]|uniref:Excreted virulence factor EspC, type VII ESX diderm n=1 Tax=Asanoa ishikariensis TaxID=137265 RepID=A0A1H3LG57_9ACTN|nr:hypothetical protein [Asanoa ishikariensis]GIF65463.1 hypothetical protein Ais01nite_34980 [Asanoa ishikariensis]SDY63422.1 hypothetical protein SAMN05421684_0739 [Asanoa ishikariensis]